MMATKLLGAFVVLIWTAGAAQATLHDTTISEPTMGYVFEVPRGCIVSQSVNGRGAQIPGCFEVDKRDGEPLVLVRTYGPGIFRALLGDGPLSEPGDTLLSYARSEAWQLCAGEGTPDSIVSLRRYRSTAGQEAPTYSWPEHESARRRESRRRHPDKVESRPGA